MEKLGNILRELREKHRFSQKLVSLRLCCSSSVISSYESGDRLPSLPVLIALADLYGVSTDYLLGRMPENSSFVSLEGLTEAQKEAVRLMVKALSSSGQSSG